MSVSLNLCLSVFLYLCISASYYLCLSVSPYLYTFVSLYLNISLWRCSILWLAVNKLHCELPFIVSCNCAASFPFLFIHLLSAAAASAASFLSLAFLVSFSCNFLCILLPTANKLAIGYWPLPLRPGHLLLHNI